MKIALILALSGILPIAGLHADSASSPKPVKKEAHAHSHGADGDEHEEDSKAKQDGKGGAHSDEHGDEHGEKHGEETGDEHGDEAEQGHGHGHGGHEEESPKFGEGKAIVEVKNEGQRFRLSPEAESVLKFVAAPIKRAGNLGQFLIPAQSLVEYQDNFGVFAKNGDWYSLIKVRLIRSSSTEAWVESKNLTPSTQVVTSNLGLLRVAHLEASGQGGEGHAH